MAIIKKEENVKKESLEDDIQIGDGSLPANGRRVLTPEEGAWLLDNLTASPPPPSPAMQRAIENYNRIKAQTSE